MTKGQFSAVKTPNGYLFTCKNDCRSFLKIMNTFNLLVLLLTFKKYTKYTRYLLIALLLLNYFAYTNYIVEERLLMLSNFGLQIERTNLLKNKVYTTIPKTDISHFLINEGFTSHKIIFYPLIILNKPSYPSDTSNVEGDGYGDVNSNETQSNNSELSNTSSTTTNVDSGLENKSNKVNKNKIVLPFKHSEISLENLKLMYNKFNLLFH